MEILAALVLCVCVALALGQGDSNGAWGEWSDASACSRTCGGGVSHRTRKCHHGMRPGLSRGCRGEDITYESCNTQPCPDGLESFRSVQCRRFSNRQSTWVPFEVDESVHNSSRCSLVCQEVETSRVQTLQERVVDGTECDTPDSFGVCLGGVCQTVGCDRHIRAVKREDPCLVCGGQGTTCQDVYRTVSEADLSPGDNDIATIPQGSTTIHLREQSPSPTLALAGRDGTVYLDTRRPPANDSLVRVEGARLRYFRSSPTTSGVVSHVVKGRGPTNATIIVKIMDYRDKQTNVEINYYIPKSRVLESNPNQPYAWIFGAWTSCSQECGDGYQLRAVSCVDRSSGASVQDQKCSDMDKPDSRQECNLKPCGSANNWYRWVPGHWGNCSVRCGVGEQTQLMYCVETGAAGDTVYVKEELCERYSPKHPVYKRACEGDGEECPYWTTTPWSQCSVTCGYGRQTRQVICQRDPANPVMSPVAVDDSLCTQEQPDAFKTCREDTCSDGSNPFSIVEVEDDLECQDTQYGCCEDGVTAAKGANRAGCSSPPTATQNVCLLEPERGPCSDYSIKWHFIPGDNKCRRFWYGGCQGNDNRFETEEACLKKCLETESEVKDQASGDCSARSYGCCRDGVTAARGPNQEGCPDEPTYTTSSCQRSRYGCCPDGTTAASGPNQQGCGNDRDSEHNDNNVAADRDDCRRSRYGCCADRVTAARGPNQEGCKSEVEPRKKCEQSYYGCCPGSDVAATGPNNQGCTSSDDAGFDPASCGAGKDRGTCSDYSVKWYYDSKDTRCSRFWYGGCGGNGNVFDTEEECKAGCVDVTGPELCRLPAVPGPCRENRQRYFYNHKVAKCQRFTYGGCRGNANRFRSLAECRKACHDTDTKDDGEDRENEVLPSNQVDQCRQTTYGCCQDGISVAAGPNYQGCPEQCESSLYGCCEDGVTPAQGSNKEGCVEVDDGSGMMGDCDDTPFGCCPDGVTAAAGPNMRGCVTTTTAPPTTTTRAPTSTTTKPTTPATGGADRCSAAPERGPCADYSIKWYYNTTRLACAQFWYGGCQGNDNRFENRDECEAECFPTEAPATEDPDFMSICDMPREEGPCRGRLTRWYYDRLDRQCRTFSYSGCQGNENNFESLQACQQTCMGIVPTAAPTTTTTTTSAPYTFSPPPVKSFMTMTGNDRLLEGQDLTLTCRAEGPTMPTDIEWFINGRRIGREHDRLSVRVTRQPSEHSVTSELTIVQSLKSNSATYICRSLPYSDVKRKTVVISKNPVWVTTTEAPYVRPEVPGTETTDPDAVCRMPQQPGRCRGYLYRWYYDFNTRSCRQFVYGGCGGNSNNFESEQDCLDYCQKDDTVQPATNRPVTYRPATYRPATYRPATDRPYTPRPYTSRPYTSRPYTSRPVEPSTGDVCSLPAVTGNCYASLPRWYYDATYGQCRQFVYGGCSGNSNNFETQEDCQSYCAGYGTKTPDTATQSSNNPIVVCQQPVQQGSCRASLQRYHYSVLEGQCRPFTYGGCEGNSNNFETEQACNDYCRTEEICSQPQNPGPCRGAFTRYYYDSASGSCQQFTYGGCDGNLNNFGSYAACQQKCTQQGGSSGTDPVTSGREVCQLNADGGQCNGYFTNWYYDRSTGRCHTFVYTGCDGNGNRFPTESECLKFCQPGVDTVLTPAPTIPRGDLCSLERERGPCSDYEIYWYYDTAQQSCARFYYGGCGGNDNRFTTREECQQRCGRRPQEYRPSTTPTPSPERRSCSYSRYGCCPDGVTTAVDAYRTNCRDDSIVVRPSENGDVVMADRGSVAVMNCYFPGSAVSWYRDGYYLNSDSRFIIHNNGTLVVRDITEEIAGIYACRINDGNNIPQIKRYELRLKNSYNSDNSVPMSILQAPLNVNGAPGENVYLHCQAFGTPTPKITWTHRGSPVYSSGRHVVFKNGTMMVSSVSQQDAGYYKCTAENGVDAPLSRNMELTISQKLDAKIQSHNGVGMEGETMTLRCEVSGYPTPSVSWEKNGFEVRSGSSKMYVQGNDLVISRMSFEDAGMYSCVARNSMGDARDTTYLQVKLENHRDKCTNTISKMKCRLIVSANLCGHRMFARKCCLSCKQAGLLSTK